MEQSRYDQIAAQLEAGVDVELPQGEWREFYAMVPRPEKKKAEVRTDNYISGHAYAYCEAHGGQLGPKYGFGVWEPRVAAARAAYDAVYHNNMYHKE